MPSTPTTKPHHILVLGAGVTGLQTALSLLTSSTSTGNSKYSITILATHFPGDSSIDYTSPWAGGHWRSHAGLSEEERRAREWDARTYNAWMGLLSPESSGVSTSEKDKEKELGLGVRESWIFWGEKYHGPEAAEDGRGLWWSAKGVVRGFEVLDLEMERRGEREPSGSTVRVKVPDKAVFGVRYQSVCINVPQYLSHLLSACTALGARVIKSSVDVSAGIEGVVRNAKNILRQEGAEEEIFALVNATGLSARHFVGEREAARLFPVRGQTILVKGEARAGRTYVGYGDEEELAYVVPRPGSGTTILGGCKQVGVWRESVDQELNARILETVAREGLVDELRGEHGKGEFEVLGFQVGYRPGRKGGPRVEVEGRVDGVWVVHSYGHAGGGYQCSVGCAESVVELIDGLN